MSPFPLFRIVALSAALSLPAPLVLAAAADYVVEIIEPAPTVGAGAIIALRLTDRRTGAPVEGAVIFATRMDMEPDGMEAMTAPVTLLPSDAPGLYRFQTDLVTAGRWRLSAAAKVQGEAETVSARLVIEVRP